MSDTILVTYASRTGSTRGVAEAIATTLNEHGASAVVLPMQEVKDLNAYRAVIAGSAIQAGQWLPEAMQFMHMHQKSLTSKPFAAFLVCMMLAMPGSEKYREHVEKFMQPVRVIVQPTAEGFFAGALDINKIPSFGERLKFRLSVMLGVWKQGDHRDWKAIRAWTEQSLPRLTS